ncbi:hypothetical protein TNCV_4294721 [Trichonephila clavipes]|uniref:Uncharacterized protein n=1 Tax=Trichonephila clavipes TaxID=2585209 RepID=A0A8X6RKU5_TRICX|nr:hypothetical protein TNCV_4294721 [Trichonephila clavipes]
MFAVCGVPYGGKWCPGDTFCIPFGPRFAVDRWQEVSAVDNGWRVHSLNPRPDAVALYSECTPGQRRAWPAHCLSCSTPWSAKARQGEVVFALMKPMQLCPGIGGEQKSIKRLRFGDLLIETASAIQSKSFLLAKNFLDSPPTVSPHTDL